MGNLIEPLDPIHWHGLNLNPVPLEFSQEFDTWKVLSAILARISLIEKTINEMEKTWQEYTDQEIDKLNDELRDFIDETKRFLVRLIELNRTELDERITVMWSELQAMMLELENNVKQWLIDQKDFLLDYINDEISRLETDFNNEINRIETDYNNKITNLTQYVNSQIAQINTNISNIDSKYQQITDNLQNQINAINTLIADLRRDHDLLRSDFDNARMYVTCPVTGQRTLIQNVLEHLFDFHREAATYGQINQTNFTYHYLDFEHSSDPEKNKVNYELMIKRTRKYFGLPEVLP